MVQNDYNAQKGCPTSRWPETLPVHFLFYTVIHSGPISIFGVEATGMLQSTITSKEDINFLLDESDEETYGCSID